MPSRFRRHYRTGGDVHWPVRLWHSKAMPGILHREFAPPDVHLVQWIQRVLVLSSAMAVATAGWWSWNSGSVEELAVGFEQAKIRTESMASAFNATMQRDQLAFSQEQVARIREEVAFANQLSDKRTFSWTKLLSDLEETLPPRVSLSSIKLNDQESIIVMEGVAGQLQDLNEFIQHLQAHRAFNQAVLDKHELRQDSSSGKTSDAWRDDGAGQSRHQYLEFRLAVRYRPLL